MIASRSLDRPGEWLLRLAEDPALYRRLLDEEGIAAAAYYVARARCAAAETATTVPTSGELSVAAQEVVRRARVKMAVPCPAALVAECEALGMLVIGPACEVA